MGPPSTCKQRQGQRASGGVMARQCKFIQNLKSIVGMALIGFGLFILFGNVADAAARLSGFIGVGADATQTFGELTVVGLAASRAFQCYLFDRVRFALGVRKLLISLWPLLLVIAGTVLIGMASRAESRNFRKRIQELSN
jgi:hypothetical protein